MEIEVIANTRETQGTGASRRSRRAGRVPAIVYGAGQEAAKIELDHNAVFHQLKNEAFHASILSLKLDGNAQQVLLRDVQMHPFRPMVLHLDFQRVSQKEKIHVKVPLHFINADIAPGVKLTGGTVTHILNEVEVSCLPKDLPEFVEVDLAELASGHSIHLSELKVPGGVELLDLAHGDDKPVATILAPRGGSDEPEAAPGVEGAGEAPAA